MFYSHFSIDAKDSSRLRLRQLARLDDPVDLQRQLRLQQFLLRIGQAEIGEQVWLSLIPLY
jgi:hypothetical protein